MARKHANIRDRKWAEFALTKRRLKFARQASRPLSVGYRKDGNRRSDSTTPFVQVQDRFTGHLIKPQALGKEDFYMRMLDSQLYKLLKLQYTCRGESF